jgi:putative transposase
METITCNRFHIVAPAAYFVNSIPSGDYPVVCGFGVRSRKALSDAASNTIIGYSAWLRHGSCGCFSMIFLLIAQLVSLFLDLFAISRRSEHHKDLQILLLWQQLRILQRHNPQKPRISRLEKLTLAILAAKLSSLKRKGRDHLNQISLLFKPDTLLRWHRELVRRKWTFKRQHLLPRRATDPELVDLLLRLAGENPSWGYSKLHGELSKLGYRIGRSTIRDVLKRQHIPPAPERANKGSSWRSFLGHYREQFIACDFFTVETAWLKTLYVLFFIELGSRRVHFAGCTPHPTGKWVTQQARQLTWKLEEEREERGELLPIQFLIHDRDAKFTGDFDAVLEAEGIEIIQTPYRAPRANAFAERWIRSAREECLDRLLIMSEAHLRRVIREYLDYYNRARPHQGIKQRCPIPIEHAHKEGPVKCRNVLGGIIHDYHRECQEAA